MTVSELLEKIPAEKLRNDSDILAIYKKLKPIFEGDPSTKA